MGSLQVVILLIILALISPVIVLISLGYELLNRWISGAKNLIPQWMRKK